MPTPPATDLTGRSAREAKRLFGGWFEELTAAADADEGAAYVFVMGSLAELVRSFEMPIVFPEIHSLQMAVRHAAGDYLSAAEDYGYSPDVCGYVKADVALQLRGGAHPLGRIPRPAIAIATNACNTYIKWAEIWERLHGTPVVTIDVPGSRGARDAGFGASPPAADLLYVERQVRELIGHLETVTGRGFDPERLREILSRVNAMADAWDRMLALGRERPSAYDALTEGTTFLGMANVFRGTAEGVTWFEQLVEELATRRGSGTPEQHRLLFVGVPCYPIFRRFWELFSRWGGVFVGSTYLWFASGGLGNGFRYRFADPVRSLAEGVLRGVRNATDAMLFHDRTLVRAIDEYGADGVVYHPIKSCRTVSTGLADSRRAVLSRRDVGCLFIESDMMDQRVVSEAQLRNRIDAFFEGLSSRRLRLDVRDAAAEAAIVAGGGR